MKIRMVLAAALTVGLAAVPSAAGAASRVGAVHGSGQVVYSSSGDDDVRFTIDATVRYPPGTVDPSGGEATGTARVYHANVNYPHLTAWADVRVDCVVTGGRTATVTGFVTDASPAVRADWINRRIGFAVTDGGGRKADRVGWTGPPVKNAPEWPRCMAPAPFFTLRSGGFSVRGVELFPI